jgi:hypothetical protein
MAEVSLADVTADSVFVRNRIPNSCVAYRRDILADIHHAQDLDLYEDWDFLFQCLHTHPLAHCASAGVVIHKSAADVPENMRRGNGQDDRIVACHARSLPQTSRAQSADAPGAPVPAGKRRCADRHGTVLRKTPAMPAITVLIPARNAEATLGETLESLVVQTWRDFDVLLVDDASTDGTRAVAESFAPRLALRVLALPVNTGVAGALNHGLAQISSPYVARIDADDVALPTRLAQQHDYLQDHPHIDACSSAVELFYPAGGQPARF